jgi:hypothetical protein
VSTECTASPPSDAPEQEHREESARDAFSRGDLAELEEAWRKSSLRSIERRSRPSAANPAAWKKLAAALLSLGAIITSGVLAFGVIERQGDALPAAAVHFEAEDAQGGAARLGDPATPSPAGVEAANRFAATRAGVVAFSIIGSDGERNQRAGDRPFVSASVVKAPLLVAELDRLERGDLPLDGTTRDLLSRMITVSDNGAADAIYGRVGDAGLIAVAKAAGMRDFTVEGYWANAQITANDMARFARNLDALLKGPHRDYANELLRNIAPYQRWGVPTAVGERWQVRFKGGWRTTELGALAHQVARLDRDGESLSLAVLTDGQTSHEYATETIQGITARLLAEPAGDSDTGARR